MPKNKSFKFYLSFWINRLVCVLFPENSSKVLSYLFIFSYLKLTTLPYTPSSQHCNIPSLWSDIFVKGFWCASSWISAMHWLHFKSMTLCFQEHTEVWRVPNAEFRSELYKVQKVQIKISSPQWSQRKDQDQVHWHIWTWSFLPVHNDLMWT